MVKKEFLDLIDFFPRIKFDDVFIKNYSTRVKDGKAKKILRTQIKKIICNPEIGKPMRTLRKGTREVYIAPYRLSYLFLREKEYLVFLSIYHKDHQ